MLSRCFLTVPGEIHRCSAIAAFVSPAATSSRISPSRAVRSSSSSGRRRPPRREAARSLDASEVRPDELEHRAVASREVAVLTIEDEVARACPGAGDAGLQLGLDAAGAEPVGVDPRVEQPAARDDVRETHGREVRVGLLVTAERVVVDDRPEVVVATAVTAVGVDVRDGAPAHVVELAVADLVARDELVQRVECLGRDRAFIRERPGDLDEVENCTKIAGP